MQEIGMKPLAARKRLGAFYTPTEVATTLVRWVVRDTSDRLLDPACGDGRFLAAHEHSLGVECDYNAVVGAVQRAPRATIHVGDFFEWADQTAARFECAAGNPPFIRYQRFTGKVRECALDRCARLGARFSGLTSSWAPFLVVAASLLKRGGRMAFIVPAEIGHKPYAVPLLRYLVRSFARVQLIAIREKVFPELSEDVWLLFTDGAGRATDHVLFSEAERFTLPESPPRSGKRVFVDDWAKWNYRLRPFLLSDQTRAVYEATRESNCTVRFRDVAHIGVGYVTGANNYFHFRPSQVRQWRVPRRFLMPTVRNGRMLPATTVTPATLKHWTDQDAKVLLLRLTGREELPEAVVKYLDSSAGREARTAYKCRTRSPWYAVPDVRVPDAFLSYLSSRSPQLVGNAAGCTCTNSVHAVTLTNGLSLSALQRMWHHDLTALSCEIEGHPLGGGALKIEPGEAARIVLPQANLRCTRKDLEAIQDGIATMRRWRHYE